MRAAPNAGIIGGMLALAVSVGALAAAAQEPAPTGNYGGGAVVDPPKDVYGAGNLSISLRATPNRPVQILANWGARCGGPFIKAVSSVGADGSFVASATDTQRGSGSRTRTKYKIAGTITGARAGGTASARSTFTRRGGRARHCKSGEIAWGARRATGELGTPGATPPGSRLYGNTNTIYGGRRHAIVLRISDDGTTVTRALYSLNLKCGGSSFPTSDAPHRGLTIGPGGQVSDIEHFSAKLDRRTRLRSVERFSGTVGSAGASGTLSIKARLIDIPSGHTFRHCRTGKVTWAAAL
jgi:hypothetical protein